MPNRITSSSVSFILAAHMLSATVLRGQDLSKGGGFCRNCVACDSTKINGLIGRLRELSKLAKDLQREQKEADAARDAARDAIYGAEGSAAGFFRGLLDLAKEGLPAAPGDPTGCLQRIAGYVDKGSRYISGGGDFAQIANDLGKRARDGAENRAIRARARAVAQQTHAATQNGAAAAEAYRNTARTARNTFKWLNIGESIANYYNSTDQLANDVQAYLDASRRADEVAKQRQDVDKLIDQIQKELDVLRAACAKAKSPPDPGVNGENAMVRLSVSLPASWKLLGPRIGLQRAHPSTTELEDMRTRLRTILSGRPVLERPVSINIAPSMAPFVFNQWRQMDAPILVALLQGIQADVKNLESEMPGVVRTGRDVETLLLKYR